MSDCTSFEPSVVYLPSASEEGQLLTQHMRHLFESRGFIFKVETTGPPTRKEYLHGCRHHSFCVIDVTVEDNGSLCSVLTKSPYLNVILLSRTHLPPDLVESPYLTVSPAYPCRFTNDQIRAALEKRGGEFEQRVRRAPDHWRESASDAWGMADLISARFDTDVFVSFRGGRWSEVRQYVEEHGCGRSIKAFTPGELAFEDEALSLYDRWTVMSVFGNYMTQAKQIWIYLSDDYLDSWWTRAEVLAMVHPYGGRKVLPKVKLLRPSDAGPLPARFRQLYQLPRRERRQLASWRMYCNVLSPSGSLHLDFAEQFRAGEIRVPKLAQRFLDIDHPVHQPESRTGRLVDTLRQPQSGRRPDSPLWFPAEEVLDVQHSGLIYISGEDLEAAVAEANPVSIAGSLFEVTESPHRYRWFPNNTEGDSAVPSRLEKSRTYRVRRLRNPS